MSNELAVLPSVDIYGNEVRGVLDREAFDKLIFRCARGTTLEGINSEVRNELISLIEVAWVPIFQAVHVPQDRQVYGGRALD